MGGKVFKDTYNVARLSAVEFNSFQNRVMTELHSRFPNTPFTPILSYRKKASFGDLDILYTGDLDFEELSSALDSLSQVRNGSVISFAVPINRNEIFQVDMIRVKPEELHSASCYFAYNDLGNILGRIFHRMGFKLGHKGLLYIVREEGNESHAVKELVVTRSWEEALAFVGYSYNEWLEGFDTLEQIFQYAVNNPLTNRTIFRLEETNHAARIRDRKRKTYCEFLSWIHDPVNNIPENEIIPKKELRAQYLQEAFKAFPNFKVEYDEAQKMLVEKRLLKAKFNGMLVRELTGLQDRALGAFIQDFVQTVMLPDKETWLRNNTPVQVLNAIVKHHRTFLQ